MIKRRNYPDENLCQFEGRFYGGYVMSEHENFKNNYVPRIDFAIDCYSSDYSPKARTPINLFALKATALAIQAKLEEGCKIYVRCVYKPEIERKGKVGKEQKIVSVTPKFEIRKFVLEAYKQESMEILAEDLAEALIARNEAEV